MPCGVDTIITLEDLPEEIVGYTELKNCSAMLFGIKANLYKKILKVSFIKFIRPEKKFKNINELKNQIKKDITAIKK